jgi:hypothetical protein
MLKEIAQEMIATQKRTGGKVAKTLKRGMTITLTDWKLSMTRDGAMPSPIEERLVLEAFGLATCARRARQQGKWFVISYMYFVFDDGMSDGERAWVELFMQVTSEPLRGESLMVDGGRLVGGAVRQAELFSVPVTQGSYSYE